MPAIECGPGRYSKMLLWPAVVDLLGQPVSDRYGRPKVSVGTLPPIELQLRLDDQARQVIGPDGKPFRIDATVSHFDRELILGSAMWRGGIDDLPGTALIPESDLLIVIYYSGTKDAKGRNTYREAYLRRYQNAMPPTKA